MTTYNGKSHYSTLGKEPFTKKEPLSYIYHKSVEKLYQLHRDRVTYVEPKVDDHMYIPDFMNNKQFKLKAKEFEELQLMKHNEVIYGRISKVENQESRIQKDAREHMKRIDVVKEYDSKLKADYRRRVADKIERENVYFHQRITRTQPFYSRKKFQEDYKHHELFKRGRRSMPCAGHILQCDKRTAAKLLKPILSISGPMSPQPSVFSRAGGGLSPGGSLTQGSLTKSLSQFPSVDSSTETFLLPLPRVLGPIKSNDRADNGIAGKQFDSFQSLGNEEDEYGSFSAVELEHKPVVSVSEEKFESTHIRLFSRTVPLPLDSGHCSLRVYASSLYDEHLYIRAVTVADPPQILAYRMLTIDQAYDISRNAKQKEHNTEDFHNLRNRLTTMFAEADLENRGYLTYGEFEDLMQKIDIGISAQELRFVIQEADENENGFVDYTEFIPLAVDMILSFHARQRAMENQKALEVSIDDEVLHQLSKGHVDRNAALAYDKIRAADQRNTGTIRPAELRRILKSLAAVNAEGLSDNEITIIISTLKKDPFGKIIYANFQETVRQVCFGQLKNMIIQSQGSDLQQYLMDIFKAEEMKILQEESDMVNAVATGYLPFRNIITLMSGSTRLSLSRLQVMVIASSAEIEDGLVNYWKFVPAAAKTIELMFQPHILKQRAELIETTDLSPTHLLNGSTPEEFLRRLKTLFTSYDLGKTGELNPRQFRAIMDSMELQLTPGEIMALMSSADTDNSGGINFEEFAEFCMNNLLHLEREKHLRLLQEAMNQSSNGDAASESLETAAMEDHLRNIFKLADHDGSGSLSYEELEVVFQSVNIHMSPFQLQVLISEMDANNDGTVSYDEFVPALADLLQAYKAKQHAVEEKRKREEWAAQKAEEASQDWLIDVRKSVKFLFDKLSLINDTIEDMISKRNAVMEVLRHPNAGLNRTEANLLLAKLYPSKDAALESSDSMSEASRARKLILQSGSDAQPLLNLETLISEIRRTTIMRGFLEALPASTIAEHLMYMFTLEAQQIKESRGASAADEDTEAVVSLPISAVFAVLEKNTQVRLNRTQILGILSWADCFEEGSQTEVNCKRFSTYAADVIVKLNDPAQMLKRANIAKTTNFDNETILNGATQQEIDDYFFTAFSTLARKKEIIDENDVSEVMKNVPKIQLSDREAVALSASVPMHADMGYDWRQFIPCAYFATLELCRERMIARRVTLLGASEMNSQDRSALQKIAENISKAVTLRRTRGKLYIVLPIDDPAKLKRSSLLVVNDKKKLVKSHSNTGPEDESANLKGKSFNRTISRNESMKKGEMSELSAADEEYENDADEQNGNDSYDEEYVKEEFDDQSEDKDLGILNGRTKAYSRTHATSLPEAYDIVRVGKKLRVISINYAGQSVDHEMSAHLGEGGDRVKGESIYFLIKFMENDPLMCPDATPLKIIATSVDGSIKFEIPIQIKLPSIGMVDGEAAKQFARNLVNKLYVEKLRNKMQLKVYDKKESI